MDAEANIGYNFFEERVQKVIVLPKIVKERL
jgi:hypothetical protein